jgi:murein DD-endopeptidase MepM/ murein hydrolase activator NlpD
MQGMTTRRALLVAAASGITLLPRAATNARQMTERFSLPIGWPGELPGKGFIVRHGYACENSWYNPGYWHTGEDWYAIDGGETAGALIYAVLEGEISFAGSEYPGRVVLIRHADDLFSMYGHLDYEPMVREGDRVQAGQPLGTVLPRQDDRAPSHLHFEVRTFLMTAEVNGQSPRYGFACGFECPPGPGYWPIDAPEHPSAMGWRNPTHVLGSYFDDMTEVEVAPGAPSSLPLWSAPGSDSGASPITKLPAEPGTRFSLRSVTRGEAASIGTSAEAYDLWLEIEHALGETAWVQAAIPSDLETGTDGRPSSVIVTLLPVPAEDGARVGPTKH